MLPHLLARARDRINLPRAASEADARGARGDAASDRCAPSSPYRCWYWEVVDLGRRVLMGGSLVLIDGQRTRAVAGLALASAFAAVYTHAGPYVSRPLNALSFAATHLVVIVYAGGVMVVCRPSAFDDTALGTALLLGSLALIAWAVALQFEKNQRTGRMLRALQRGGGDGAARRRPRASRCSGWTPGRR